MCDPVNIGFNINQNRFFSQKDLLKTCKIKRTDSELGSESEPPVVYWKRNCPCSPYPFYKSHLQRTEIIRNIQKECVENQ